MWGGMHGVVGGAGGGGRRGNGFLIKGETRRGEEGWRITGCRFRRRQLAEPGWLGLPPLSHHRDDSSAAVNQIMNSQVHTHFRTHTHARRKLSRPSGGG